MDNLNNLVYLDYNASTPCDPRVVHAMTPYFSDEYGNAGSNHFLGWKAAKQVEKAREAIAALIGAEPSELYFTSGASEGIQLALFGILKARSTERNSILVSATEHHVVHETLHALAHYYPIQIIKLPVQSDGVIDLDEAKRLMSQKVLMIIAMGANNETGVMNPLEELSELAAQHGAILFCDATQMPGKCILDAGSQGFHAGVLSSHKFYGPKGVGVLYIKRKNPRVSFLPPFASGSHENGLRAGTLNVSGIVGMGVAAEIAMHETWDDMARISVLRTRFEQALASAINVYTNGSVRNRICNTSNLYFPGISSTALIQRTAGIACSIGAACSKPGDGYSHVLTAMQFPPERIRSSIRYSIGKYTTTEEIEKAVIQIIHGVKALRSDTN